MKIELSIILLLLTNSFESNSQTLSELQNLKNQYDSIRTQFQKEQIILVRTTDNDLIKVVNSKWPENILTTYNLLTDKNNKVMIIGIYPFSKSGDSDLEHLYYFDSSGQTFSYKHQLNFFNSICEDGVLKQKTIYFYNNQSNEIEKIYSLTNKDDDEIEGQNCVFNYAYEPRIYRSYRELVKKEKIKTAGNNGEHP